MKKSSFHISPAAATAVLLASEQGGKRSADDDVIITCEDHGLSWCAMAAVRCHMEMRHEFNCM